MRANKARFFGLAPSRLHAALTSARPRSTEWEESCKAGCLARSSLPSYHLQLRTSVVAPPGGKPLDPHACSSGLTTPAITLRQFAGWRTYLAPAGTTFALARLPPQPSPLNRPFQLWEHTPRNSSTCTRRRRSVLRSWHTRHVRRLGSNTTSQTRMPLCRQRLGQMWPLSITSHEPINGLKR